MEEKNIEWYRGVDVMNSQKKLLLQRLRELIQQEQGELAYFLNRKDITTQQYRLYTKELIQIIATQVDTPRKERLKNKLVYMDTIQWDILKILQPMYNQIFDTVAQEISPGKEYNEELRQDIWFDLIFGEKEISDNIEGSRDSYRLQSLSRWSQEKFEKKRKKYEEERKKAKEKVRLPKNHKLLHNKNYLSTLPILIKKIETYIPIYMEKLGISLQDSAFQKMFFQKYMIYLFIRVFIEEKLVFDMKSTKAKKCLDGTLEELFRYFWEKYGELAIDLVDFKRKLRNNTKSDTDPMDLSYMNATLEDVQYREDYLNTTYFVPQHTTINDLRKEIMKKYESGIWIIEKVFEFLNPWYYIHKDHIDKHIKHITILKDYQKKLSEPDPHITTIIQEIEQKLLFSQQKKKEYTKLEEKFPGIKSKPQYSMTQIQQQRLKRYKVPIQYRHIFGIVINKLNNFYQIKMNIAKKSDKINQELLERLIYSDREWQHFSYYLHNYMTFARMDKIFDKEWSEKWEKRLLEIKNTCIYGERIKKENEIKENKKTKRVDSSQLSLDL